MSCCPSHHQYTQGTALCVDKENCSPSSVPEEPSQSTHWIALTQDRLQEAVLVVDPRTEQVLWHHPLVNGGALLRSVIGAASRAKCTTTMPQFCCPPTV